MAQAGRLSESRATRSPIAQPPGLQGQGGELHLLLDLRVGKRPVGALDLVGQGIGQVMPQCLIEKLGDGLDHSALRWGNVAW